MQRDISDKNTLGDTLNPYNDARRSTAIDRTASNHDDAKKWCKKLEISLIWGNVMLISQNVSPEFLN